MRRKLLSLALAFAMCLCLLPGMARAEGPMPIHSFRELIAFQEGTMDYMPNGIYVVAEGFDWSGADGSYTFPRGFGIEGDWVIPENVTIINQASAMLKKYMVYTYTAVGEVETATEYPSTITINGSWVNKTGTLFGEDMFDYDNVQDITYNCGHIYVNGKLSMEGGESCPCDMTVNTGGTLQITNSSILGIMRDHTLELKDNVTVEGADPRWDRICLDGDLICGENVTITAGIQVYSSYMSDPTTTARPTLQGTAAVSNIEIRRGTTLTIPASSEITCTDVTCGSFAEDGGLVIDGQLNLTGNLQLYPEHSNIQLNGKLALQPGSRTRASYNSPDDPSVPGLITGSGTIEGIAELNEDGTAAFPNVPYLFEARWHSIKGVRPDEVAETVKFSYNWKIPGEDDASGPNEPGNQAPPSEENPPVEQPPVEQPPAVQPEPPYYPYFPDTPYFTDIPSSFDSTTPSTPSNPDEPEASPEREAPAAPEAPAESEIPVEPQQPVVQPPVAVYADVAPAAWYSEAAGYVAVNGLMTGTSATEFSPNEPMTRAMLWTVLGRMDGADVDGGTGAWYAKAQNWGIDRGISDGLNADASITRQEMVTMLWRYIGSPIAATDLSIFRDGTLAADWADAAIQWAVVNGILEGSNGLLNPDGTATRAEVAAILMRFCESVIK